MKLIRFLLCIYTFLLIFNYSIFAEIEKNVDVILKTVSSSLDSINSVYCEFIQEKHISFLKEPVLSEGIICFEKPDNIRWETIKPYKTILISNGKDIAQFEYISDEWKKLTIGYEQIMKIVLEHMALVWKGDFFKENDNFIISGNDNFISMKSSGNSSVILRGIDIFFSDDLVSPKKIIIRESEEDYTVVKFLKSIHNPSFPESVFDINKPISSERLSDVLQ